MFVYYSVHKVPRWAYDSRSGNWYCWWLSHVPVFHELVIWGARSEKGGMAQGVGWGNSIVQFVTLDSPPSLFFFLIHRWNMKYRLCGRFESTCFTMQFIMKYSYWIQHKYCLQVLTAKLKKSQELKRKLGITAWGELQSDITQGIKNVKETTTWVKCWCALSYLFLILLLLFLLVVF